MNKKFIGTQKFDQKGLDTHFLPWELHNHQ